MFPTLAFALSANGSRLVGIVAVIFILVFLVLLCVKIASPPRTTEGTAPANPGRQRWALPLIVVLGVLILIAVVWYGVQWFADHKTSTTETRATSVAKPAIDEKVVHEEVPFRPVILRDTFFVNPDETPVFQVRTDTGARFVAINSDRCLYFKINGQGDAEVCGPGIPYSWCGGTVWFYTVGGASQRTKVTITYYR